MTFEEFREKLIPFFTPAQIGRLDTEAIQSALDAHAHGPHAINLPASILIPYYGYKRGTIEAFKTIHDEGRDFICQLIADYIEAEPAFIEKLSGDVIPWNKRKALILQIDNEW